MARAMALIGAFTTLGFLAVTGCGSRTLKMPPAELLPSVQGPVIEVSRVRDERSRSTLGKVDTIMIESGPDLPDYVEVELINTLSQMGLSVRQGVGAESEGSKRVQVSLLAVSLECESTLMYPVLATAILRVELTGEAGQVSFRREFRGSSNKDLGYHRQGGPEEAELLAAAVTRAVSGIREDKAFVAAAFGLPGEVAHQVPSGGAGVGTPQSGSFLESERAQTVGDKVPVRERLIALDRLLEEELITREDYVQKRKEILGDL